MAKIREECQAIHETQLEEQEERHKAEMKRLTSQAKNFRTHTRNDHRLVKERGRGYRRLMAKADALVQPLHVCPMEKRFPNIQGKIDGFSANSRSKQQDLQIAQLEDTVTAITAEKDWAVKDLEEKKLELVESQKTIQLQKQFALDTAAQHKQEICKLHQELKVATSEITQLKNDDYRRERDELCHVLEAVKSENSYLQRSVNPESRRVLPREAREASMLKKQLEVAKAEIQALQNTQHTGRVSCGSIGNDCAYLGVENRKLKKQVEQISTYTETITRLEKELKSTQHKLKTAMSVGTKASEESKVADQAREEIHQQLRRSNAYVELLEANSGKCQQAIKLTSMFADYK